MFESFFVFSFACMNATQTHTNELKQFGATYTERVSNALELLKQGKGILLVDDENRENEGDLIFPAASMTVADMALMIRECSGIVCLCITGEKAQQLALEPMVMDNTSRFSNSIHRFDRSKGGCDHRRFGCRQDPYYPHGLCTASETGASCTSGTCISFKGATQWRTQKSRSYRRKYRPDEACRTRALRSTL
jgi:hypothetical protein